MISPTTSPSGLRVAGLQHAYDDGAPTLAGIDLNIEPGALVSLLGPSGSGKTTLLRSIAGYLAPTHGEIFLGERAITNLPPEVRDIGRVFQSYALFPHLSALENVAFGLRARGIGRSERKRLASEALARVSSTDAEAMRCEGHTRSRVGSSSASQSRARS